ncbi:MAG: zinc ABC transporter substrate-binding protein [Chloroflexi bacterium]|nr:zinc ABC transporter substrate-binding protein [Chloroflexota bacterium]
MGDTLQPTSTGQMVLRSVDGLVSFSDATQTYVLDPSGKVQVRGPRERFPWEFNADGFPLVGEQLVIENGLGYDDFSDHVLSTLSQQPLIINAGDVVGLEVGANPHVWYSTAYVDQIRSAITAGLEQLAPAYAAYFEAQSAAVGKRMTTYHSLVSEVAQQFAGTPVGATETIFAYMADSTGLQLVSPSGFMQSVSEGNEPSARDIAIFHDQISSQRIQVLVYNTQTLTSLVDQFQQLAHDNNILTVGVSETMPPDAQTFQGWQATELQLLLNALQNASARGPATG